MNFKNEMSFYIFLCAASHQFQQFTCRGFASSSLVGNIGAHLHYTVPRDYRYAYGCFEAFRSCLFAVQMILNQQTEIDALKKQAYVRQEKAIAGMGMAVLRHSDPVYLQLK